METWVQDIRFGARMLRRNLGFTAVAALTLALGIGVNSSIFTVINAVLLRPLPYPNPNQLVQVLKDWKPEWRDTSEVTANFREEELRTFLKEPRLSIEIAAYSSHEANLSGGDQPERVSFGGVTPSLLPMLGVHPALGRNFLPIEDQPGSSRVVILSHGLWQRRFGEDPKIIGKIVRLNEQSYEVVGVLPLGAQLPLQCDLLLPDMLSEEILRIKHMSAFPRIIGRLPQGKNRERIQAILAEVHQSTSLPGHGRILLRGFQEQLVSGVKRGLLVFLGAVGMILLIAWLNVTNLLLARASSRRNELAVRTALGADPLRIARQLLTETVLISFLGGILGLFFSMWTSHLLYSFTRKLPTIGELSINLRVILFTFGVSLISGILFGIPPALIAIRFSFSNSAKEVSRIVTSGIAATRLHGLLVVVEVALAVVLLLGSGLLLKSFVRLCAIDPGFRPDRMLSFTVDLSSPRYPGSRSQSAYFEQLISRLQSVPGVRAIAADATLPLGSWSLSSTLEIEGRSIPGREIVFLGIVNAGYFQALGISLVRGQPLSDMDRPGKPGVVVVNNAFVKRYFPSEEPIGRRIQTWSNEWKTIVGIVSDVRLGLDQEPIPLVYHSFLQTGVGVMSFAVKTDGDPLKFVSAVKACAMIVDKDQPIYSVLTMEQRLADSLEPRRLNMILLGTFSLLALGLAAIGIYGVISYLVTQRTHEIGVRMALGASRRSVARLVVTRGIILVLPGIVIGLLVGIGATRAIASQLYAVPSTDPMTFCAVSVVLVLTALAACSIPARRASITDPMIALRYE